MASFEMLGKTPPSKDQQIMKYPIKRVEVTIQKFIRVLQMDLERLKQHKNNILKCQRLRDFEALNKEQMNASRTVQQLASNLKQLDQTRKQVLDVDLDKFDNMIANVKAMAVGDLQQFLNIHGQPANDGGQGHFMAELKPFEACCTRSDSTDRMKVRESGQGASEEVRVQSQLQEAEDQLSPEELRLLEVKCTAAEQSWLELEQNLVDLNHIVSDFSSLVHTQQKAVDTIEDKVEESQVNVEKGTSYLAQAAKYKGALLPVLGALVGGAVGGPVGLLAGLKVGGVVAVGGGIMGFTGGALLKKKKAAQVDQDMVEIIQRQSQRLQENT